MRRRIDVAEWVTEVRGMLSWGLPKNHQQRSVPVPRSWSTPWPSSSPERQNSSSPPCAALRNLDFRRDVFDRAAIVADRMEAAAARVPPACREDAVTALGERPATS